MRFAEIQEHEQINEFFPALIPAVGILFKAGMYAWSAYEAYQLYKAVRGQFRAYQDGWIELDELIAKAGKTAVMAMAEFVAILLGVKLVTKGGKIAIQGMQKRGVDLSFNNFKKIWNDYKAKQETPA